MKENLEEIALSQKEALGETLEEIEKCRVSQSKTLEIGHNSLIAFPQEIRQLTHLTNLSVIATDIRILPDWIGELENLRTLDISSNQKITKLPPSLVNLRCLKKLILDNTGVKKLPEFIGKMTSLELLDISMYGIKEVPECILNLPRLKRIITREYHIDHLPSLVFKQLELNRKESLHRIERCRKLQTKKLDLSRLYLDELPNELSDLVWLEELDFMSNRLKQLPDSIGSLKNLKTIILSHNRLETLPETFCGLVSLEYFMLCENHNYPYLEEKLGQGSWFTRLPESFGKLSSLKGFCVSDTKITGLPESFGNLTSLKYLSIQESLMTDFYFPPAMKNLKALREVRLSALDHVPEFIAEMKELSILDLSHNKLETLPDFIGNLKKLKELYLHSTWIKELPDWILNLKKLRFLDISGNDISTIPEILKKLPNLEINTK